jgi:hypothetical protein
MTDPLEAFLAGNRLDDVALFLADAYVDDPEALADQGVRVDGGVVIVVDGERGRRVFGSITGADAMGFAREAGATEGEIAPDLAGGTCPEHKPTSRDLENGDGQTVTTEHAAQFVFAFAEAQNEDVGDIYAEGDVIHAYARCDCGAGYSHRWIAGDR